MPAQSVSTVQTQTAKQEQHQEQSALHRQEIRLLRMEQMELEDDVLKTLENNLALEPDDGFKDDSDFSDTSADSSDDYDTASESADDYDSSDDYSQSEADEIRPEKQELTDEDYDSEELNNYISSDDIPYTNYRTDSRERVQASSESFDEMVKEQVVGCDLTDKERHIMDYLIGSLDNYGFLRKATPTLCLELRVNEDLDVKEPEVERVITVLQSFEPAGIGARDFQECLVLQLRRRDSQTPLSLLATRILAESFTDFYNKHYDKLCRRYKIDQPTLDEVYSLVRHLNPYPASSEGDDTMDFGNQIIPDFIIDEDDNGIVISLNRGRLPKLKLSRSYSGGVDNEYIRKQIGEAKLYMQAIKQRQETMMRTMRAIVHLQPDFFRTGDEDDLHPMTQQDVATLINRDPSTVSGVVSNKYADTPYGLIRLGDLFRQKAVTGSGVEISTEAMRRKMVELISQEDKTNPISDDALAEKLGVARRTIAKYRKALNIPVARLRR